MRKNTLQLISCVGTVAVLLIATGCSTPKDERSEGRTIDDKKITENVRKDLDNNPTYKFTQVDVSTFAGIVQLSGFVNTQGEKDQAQQIAESVNGVHQVSNGIALKPEMPATGRAQQRIYADPNSSATAPKDKD